MSKRYRDDDDSYRPRMQRNPYERIEDQPQNRGGSRKIRALIGIILTIVALAAVVFGALLLVDSYDLLPDNVSDILNVAQDATEGYIAEGTNALGAAIGKAITATTSLVLLIAGTVVAVVSLLFTSSATKSSSSGVRSVSKLMKFLGFLSILIGAAGIVLMLLLANGIIAL